MKTCIVYPLLTVFITAGCATTVFLTPEDLRADPSQSIMVVTTDGGRIALSGGNYSLTPDSLQAQAIVGEGKRFQGKTPQFVAFHGRIPVAEIDTITASRTSPLLYIFLGGTAGVVALALLMRSMGSLGG